MRAEAQYSYEEKLHHYSGSAPEYKVKYILENYGRFLRIVAAYELNWQIIINAERRYHEEEDKGHTGVRIQMSGISDPTMKDAISNVEIQQAQTKSDLQRILKNTDDSDEHIEAKLTIQDMQDDYTILQNIIHTLGERDEERLLRYLHRENEGLQTLADECQMELSAYKKQIYSLKKMVMLSAVECIDLKYKIMQRKV